MKKAVDFSNNKIGKLLVLRRVENKVNKDGGQVVCWLCRCECGEEVVRRSSHLKRGRCKCKKCKAIEDAKKFGFMKIRQHHWYEINQNAKRNKREFNIDIQYVWEVYELQGGKCALTGMPISFADTKDAHAKGETTASLDRIDSRFGYIKGNVQWVHKWINCMKWDLTTEEFVHYCKMVANHSESKCQTNQPNA